MNSDFSGRFGVPFGLDYVEMVEFFLRLAFYISVEGRKGPFAKIAAEPVSKGLHGERPSLIFSRL